MFCRQPASAAPVAGPGQLRHGISQQVNNRDLNYSEVVLDAYKFNKSRYYVLLIARMLRRLASDVARLAVARSVQNCSTSCTQNAVFAVAAYSMHQSTLAFSPDLKVGI